MANQTWVRCAGGGDRIHLFCERCDESITVLLPMSLKEAPALMGAYLSCHDDCSHTLWNERIRLRRLLWRRAGLLP